MKEDMTKIDELQHQIDELNCEIVSLRDELMTKEDELNKIYSSFGYKLIKLPRKFVDLVKRILSKTYFTQCIADAIAILIYKGPKELWISFKRFLDRKGAPLVPRGCLDVNGDGVVPYDSEYEDNVDFSSYSTDVKALAFYLPQFHAFPENDEWWGKGFTEWTNVKRAHPRFTGHYQPRVPHDDIGYYKLDSIEAIEKQAKLAKQHGIYGFCFYYYWFSGKRLMEKPVDLLMDHPEIDLPFCLCWANENWTRTWDGMEKNVLIAQNYSDEDDLIFVRDMERYIRDPRYIRINGKPLIVVYNPGQIPNCHKSFKVWREEAKKLGLGEILIWTCQTANNTAKILGIEDCIDAEVEFPPHNMWRGEFGVTGLDVNEDEKSCIYNYQRLVDQVIKDLRNESPRSVPVHHTWTLGWDNSARKRNNFFCFYGFSLKYMYRWISAILDRARKDFAEEERFIFVNAWNEWGEGTYLEPDAEYGYASINTVSRALFNLPFKEDLCVIHEDSDYPCKATNNEDPRIAVQIHMFYVETMEEIVSFLNNIPEKFDCFISTDTEDKKGQIKSYFDEKCKCANTFVGVYENRGRDVAPFIEQMKSVCTKYEYILHIHSKKTNTSVYGDDWREFIFRHLLGSTEYVSKLIGLFDNNSDLGIIMPETFSPLQLQAIWGGNKEGTEKLLEKLSCKVSLPQQPVFPVGNMFWARTEAVKVVFSDLINQRDFPDEAGQLNSTLAHQIERAWVYIAKSNGYRYLKVVNGLPDKGCVLEPLKRTAIYVHYDKSNSISDADIKALEYYSDFFSELLFVSNSSLSEDDINTIKKFTEHIVVRDNVGLDFGAWKEVLLKFGRDYFKDTDELVLLNNSCFAPVYPLEEVFFNMEKKQLDFWGITVFPESSDGKYLGLDKIPEHLQSYFTVYGKKVLNSDVFWGFWESMPVYSTYKEVVRNCETQLTGLLKRNGFTYSPYITESYYICQYLNNYAVPYEKPGALLLLRDPFIKKKALAMAEKQELLYMKQLESGLEIS